MKRLSILFEKKKTGRIRLIRSLLSQSIDDVLHGQLLLLLTGHLGLSITFLGTVVTELGVVCAGNLILTVIIRSVFTAVVELFEIEYAVL